MRLPNYQGSRGVSINLTPMIDVTFLLIIFFLVSSHMAKQENFLPIDLPLASTGTADFSDQNTLTIQIPSDGVYPSLWQAAFYGAIARGDIRSDAASGRQAIANTYPHREIGSVFKYRGALEAVCDYRKLQYCVWGVR